MILALRTIFAALALLLCLGACKKELPAHEVAAAYLQANAKKDQKALKELVDPACASSDVGTGKAFSIAGTALTLVEGGTIAIVGDLRGDKVTAEMMVGAKDIKSKGLSVSKLEMKRTMKLKKIDGSWKVSCEP